jgi:hypothetical protein
MIIDLSQNPKQEEFYNKCIEALYGLNNYRNLSYGGAIRGGKSVACSAVFLTAATVFENSRWHIFRADMPALQATTVPTFEKIIAGSPKWGWNRDKSNFFIYNKKSDAKIFFRGENISHDPELNDLLGLETNGLWFEQIEELSKKLWEIGQSRNGSWYIPKMPKPITLSTFNPTQTWIKSEIYDKWRRNELKEPYYFQHALPSDNAYVTTEQWDAWGRMAERYQKQFIEGDWTDFSNKDNLWAFAFDRKKHLGRPELKKDQLLYLSFDFNKNPISCLVAQWYDNKWKFIEAIKLNNSDIYALCNYILVHYKDYVYMVTGDASGQNTSALVKDNLNFYVVIKQMLGISGNQMKVPSVNPRLEENQVLFNSILANYPVEMHEEKCRHLIFDLENVRTTLDGGIDKTNRNDPTQQADILDCARYLFNIFMYNFLHL